MAKELSILQQQAEAIKNEKNKGANTSNRIGGMFNDMLDYNEEKFTELEGKKNDDINNSIDSFNNGYVINIQNLQKGSWGNSGSVVSNTRIRTNIFKGDGIEKDIIIPEGYLAISYQSDSEDGFNGIFGSPFDWGTSRYNIIFKNDKYYVVILAKNKNGMPSDEELSSDDAYLYFRKKSNIEGYINENIEIVSSIIADVKKNNLNEFIASNNIKIPLYQKSTNRLYSQIFERKFINLFEILYILDLNYQIILGVSDNEDMSDEEFVDDYTNSINLINRAYRNYFRITVRRKDDAEINASDLSLLCNKKNFTYVNEDYSNFGITNNYISADGTSLNGNSGSDCTDFIPVKLGQTVIYSGYPGDNMLGAVWGYETKSMSNPTRLIASQGKEMTNVKIDVPYNINYIRAWSRNKNHTITPSKLQLIVTQYTNPATLDDIRKEKENIIEEVYSNILLKEVPKPNIILSTESAILITGASFATAGSTSSSWEANTNGYNRWFEQACKDLGIKGYNHAIGAQSIINTANMMLDADEEKPHGTLFLDNGKDIFDEVDSFIIMHVHNQDVNYTGDKTLEDYKSNGVNGYAEGFDYVIKQYMQWCLDARKDSNSKHYNSQLGKPCQILLCTHWHDARTIYNISVRELCIKTGIPLCEFDKKVGFSKDYPMPDGNQVSIYHCWDSNAIVGDGAKEEIDGVIYGWHMKKPTYTDVDNYTLPYIQKKLSAIFKECFTITNCRIIR